MWELGWVKGQKSSIGPLRRCGAVYKTFLFSRWDILNFSSSVRLQSSLRRQRVCCENFIGCVVRLEVAGDKWAIAILNVLIPDGWSCYAMSKVCRVVGLAGFMLLSGIEMTIITLSNIVIATDAPHHDLLSLCRQMSLDLTVLTFPGASTRDAPCCGPPGNFCFLKGKNIYGWKVIAEINITNTSSKILDIPKISTFTSEISTVLFAWQL